MARASFAVAKDVTKPARGPDIRVGGPRRPDQPRQRRDAEAAKPPGVALLRGFVLPFADDILGALGDITVQAQFPCMSTPSGALMSVAMTNCGDTGWLSDRGGYHYDRIDQKPAGQWPAMLLYFSPLATTNSSVKMALPPLI